MANLDTAAKRHSGLSVDQPWRTVPIPSGTVSRPAAALMYGGIAAATAISGPYKLAARQVYVPGVAAAQVYIGGVTANEVVT